MHEFIRTDHDDGATEYLQICRLPAGQTLVCADLEGAEYPFVVQVTTTPCAEPANFVGIYDLDGEQLDAVQFSGWEIAEDVPPEVVDQVLNGWERGGTTVQVYPNPPGDGVAPAPVLGTCAGHLPLAPGPTTALTDFARSDESYLQALTRAVAEGYRIDHYSTPLEGAREGITPAQADEIASQDPGLISLSRWTCAGCGNTTADAIWDEGTSWCDGCWADRETGDPPASVRCESGQATGERCAWTGPAAETEVVEWMPEHLRESHRAAGNSGVYPANGALRLRCCSACAEMLADDA